MDWMGTQGGETKEKRWAMVIERMRARPRLMRAEKREGKGFHVSFHSLYSGMNYSCGGKQENINLTLFLNSDSAPSRRPVSNLPSPALAFKQTGAEGIVETSCLVQLNLQVPSFFKRRSGFQNSVQLKRPQWKKVLNRCSRWEEIQSFWSQQVKYLHRERCQA